MRLQQRHWLESASLKGVEVRKKKREAEEEIIASSLSLYIGTEEGKRALARLCGFIMGDGCLEIRREGNFFHHEIRFYPDDEFVAQLFSKTFSDLYLKVPSTTSLGKYYRVLVVSRFACKHLTNITSFSTLGWRVPFEILHNDVVKYEFIRALFDCEGYVSKKNVQFQSVNKDGIYQLQSLLSDLSIKSKIYSYKRKNPSWNKNYILVISRRDNIINFLNKVGFNHPKKKMKLISLAKI